MMIRGLDNFCSGVATEIGIFSLEWTYYSTNKSVWAFKDAHVEHNTFKRACNTNLLVALTPLYFVNYVIVLLH